MQHDTDQTPVPQYAVIMQGGRDLPPDLLLEALENTFHVVDPERRSMAMAILTGKMVPFGAYSVEIAEAKAQALAQFMLRNGRELETCIAPYQKNT